MTEVDCVVNTLTTDIAYALEDYLDVPNRCFSVAITLADVLQELDIDAEVHAVWTSAHQKVEKVLGSVWNTRSARRPKHVILRVEDRFIDVTSRQIAPEIPWVMEVKVDRSAMFIGDWQLRYDDMGIYIPSKTMFRKAYSYNLATLARGMFTAAFRKNNIDFDSPNRFYDDEYWQERQTTKESFASRFSSGA